MNKKQLLLAAASVLLTLMLLEAGVRIWLDNFATRDQVAQFALYSEIPAENLQWSPHPYLNYYPTPGYEKDGTTHNSLGYRGHEFPVEKPEGEFRIVALGGSTTYTTGVQDDALTFPAQLEAVLHEAYGLEQVRVINAGAAGYTSWESLVNLVTRVIHLDPDLVIVYHGVNDVHARLVSPKHYSSDNTGKVAQWNPPPVPWFEHSALLRLISRLAGWTTQVGLGAFVESSYYRAPRYYSRTYAEDERDPADFDMVLLQQNLPVFFEQNLRNMAAVSEENGVRIMFATWAHSPFFNDYVVAPIYQQGIRENNAVVARVAEETGVPLLDFVSLMPQDRTYWADGRHVNEAGARLKAELFAAFIVEAGLLE